MARVATVFGGSGFLGRYVVKRLARQGWVVRVAVRNPQSALFLQPLGDVGQIVRLPVALQDETAVRKAVEGADAVFNLVGILYEKGRQTFDAVHHQGARRIAEAAAGAGVRQLVHVSAVGADPKSPSAYARSKAQGEQAVREAFPEAAILRPSLVVGPEDDFFNRFAVLARLSPALPLIGGGHTRFQPAYVGDVADAVMAAVAEPERAGRTYELGGPHVYTFKELMQLLLKEIRRKRLLVPVPFTLAEAEATLLEMLPVPPLTRDQVILLRIDNVVSGKYPGFADLEIDPHAIEVILPSYLHVYRPGGRFAHPREA